MILILKDCFDMACSFKSYYIACARNLLDELENYPISQSEAVEFLAHFVHRLYKLAGIYRSRKKALDDELARLRAACLDDDLPF